MIKYLLTIEFRYCDAPKYEDDGSGRIKKITIGIYDSFSEACASGNNLMENLESKFDLHVFPDGRVATKHRFNEQRDLITNLAYLKVGFSFYAKIQKLHLDSVDDAINNVVNSVNSYREYKRNLQIEN